MKKPSARDLALKVLYSVNEEEAYSNIELNKVLVKYDPEKLDRAFITELVYGVLRFRGTLDWVLGQYMNRPLDKISPWIREILRLGVYQLMYMDKVPPSAAVNESVNLAKKYGHQGVVKFVNGVLRNIGRNLDNLAFPDINKDPIGHIAAKYSHPRWMVERWIGEFGVDNTEAICIANNSNPPNTVRTNTLKTSREDLAQVLNKENIVAEFCKYAPEGLNIKGFKSIGTIPEFSQGLFLVQDESSMLPAHALSPQPGSLVIDACSAPGGKTTHLAQLMENRGKIIAADIHRHKMELIRENAERLGIDIIETVLTDARQLQEKFTEAADYILLDAPCSGLGVLRRRPEIRWRKKPETINELHQLNRDLLAQVAKCLKPGGRLVYSTCTITAEENQEVVEEFVQNNPDFQFGDILNFLPPDLPGFNDKKGLGYIQLLPQVDGMDGFFIASLEKKVK